MEEPTLNISALVKKQQGRDLLRKKVYRSMLGSVYKRIEHASNHDSCECTFNFPEVIPGKPLYDVKRCIKYVKKRLVAKKLKVSLSADHQLLISWKHLLHA